MTDPGVEIGETEGVQDEWLDTSPSEGDQEDWQSITLSFLDVGRAETDRKMTNPDLKEDDCQEDASKSPVLEKLVEGRDEGGIDSSHLRKMTLSSPDSKVEQESKDRSGRILTSTDSLVAEPVVGGSQLGPTAPQIICEELNHVREGGLFDADG